MAFRVIQGALSVIVTQIRTLASLASEVDRLHYLLVCMEGMVPSVSIAVIFTLPVRTWSGVDAFLSVSHTLCRPQVRRKTARSSVA